LTSSSPRSLEFFGLDPKRLHFVEIGACRPSPSLRQSTFDMGEPLREFGVGGAQRSLGVHVQVASQIRHRKEKIADLVGQRLGRTAAKLGFDLSDLLPKFDEHCPDVIPVEPNLRSLLLELQRARQRRQGEGDVAECAARRLSGQAGRRAGLDAKTLFVGLCSTPQSFDRSRVPPVSIAEDMRMAAYKLRRDALDHTPEVKQSRFLRHARVEDDLQQEIAQLVAQVVRFAPLNRIGDLVGLLNREGRDRCECLFQVPGTNRLPDREAQP
jgi:hypothetical protein